MIITVKRFKSDDEATLSIIYVDGKFVCFGLEDEYRATKVVKETRIPSGVYKIGLRTVGGFHHRYTSKFKFHRGMLQVLGVPGFEYILIHIGNTDENTDGCLLVGSGCTTLGELSIQSSAVAYEKLYNMVIESVINTDGVIINFEDNDL